jgi:hypothetical protein
MVVTPSRPLISPGDEEHFARGLSYLSPYPSMGLENKHMERGAVNSWLLPKRTWITK